MAGMTKEILAKLRLDSKDFSSKISEGTKGVLKFTAGLTAVSAAVVAATKFTADYRDEAVKAARAAGATAEDFSGLMHAADLSGVSMEQLAKGLRKINDPSKEAQAEMARLGVSMRDANGNMRTQNEILYELADKIKGIESPAQKSAAAVKIFGERNAAMVNLMAGGSEGLRAMAEEADRMGLVFDTKAGEAAELFNDNITRLTSSVKGCVQQITGGIIEFVNATGIMETLSGAVQAVTGWWRSLDEGTRQMIITVGGVVAGIAALVLACAGIIAIAPAVGAAITFMTGGLNLIVIAVAAAIAAFVTIAVAAAKHWDQVKTAIMPAVEAVQNAVSDIISAFEPLVSAFSSIASSIGDTFGDIVDDFKTWFGITDDMTGKVSILGTVAKVVFAGIGSAIIVVIGAFQLLNDTIQLIGTSIEALGQAFYQAVINQDFDAAKVALSKIGDAALKLKNDFVGIGDKIRDSFSNIVVTVDPKDAKKNLDDLKNDFNKVAERAESDASIASKLIGKLAGDLSSFVGKASEGFTKLGNDVIGVVQNIASNLDLLMNETADIGVKASAAFGIIGKAASSIMATVSDAIIAPIRAGIERANYYMDIYAGTYTARMQSIIDATEAAEDEKIARLSSAYDEQIRMLEDAERRKTSAVEFAANERLLLADAEYQAAREKAEEEYQLWLEQEAIRYEAEKEILLQKSIDKEQAMLVEEIMDNDFKLYLENNQAAHDTYMSELAADYSAKSKVEQQLFKDQQALIEETSKEKIKKITEEKNIALETAEEQKNNKLIALEERKQAEEKRLKKLQMLMNWKAEQGIFEQTKGMKISETLITGIAGAASAFAMAAGSIPIVGIILGAVLMAAVLAMTFASVAQIAMQRPPAAPAALFLASGGVLSGPSHAQGGIPATMEGGEAVIDRARTERLLDSFDMMTGAGRGINVYFEQGAIINNGKEAGEALIDQIADAFARKLERQGVYAI
jgi:hypothetical protein